LPCPDLTRRLRTSTVPERLPIAGPAPKNGFGAAACPVICALDGT
jgi:hypothetical protein